MASDRIHILLFILVLVLMVCAANDANAARDDSIGADQGLAQREGLGQKELDANKMPGALEYAIVIGSVIAAIGVVKFA